MKIGLTLPNRGVLFGVTTVEEMLTMAERAEASGLFNSVWVGDSMLAKPRLESLTLLAAVAGRTRKLRIGPACMASFPLRDPVLLAYQWASLDLIAGGRTVLVACTGIVEQEGGKIEGTLYNVGSKERVERLIEWIKILKKLWTEDDVSFEGEHYKFEHVTIEPKPAAKPRPPIWIANNARGDRAVIERTHRRVVRHADGWQTSISDYEDVRWRIGDIRAKAVEMARDPKTIEIHLYHNINVNADQSAALEESKKFLEAYYMIPYAPERVASWTAAGDPGQCVEHLLEYARMGVDEVTLRCTSWDQMGQLERVIRDVLPRLNEALRAVGPVAA
jgi:alkanesulfonate monooxygenase SsuD/methylene tetrahydromethanopterin reductase-like flavin-dependent oxidoreductase (luciferase family)